MVDMQGDGTGKLSWRTWLCGSHQGVASTACATATGYICGSIYKLRTHW